MAYTHVKHRSTPCVFHSASAWVHAAHVARTVHAGRRVWGGAADGPQHDHAAQCSTTSSSTACWATSVSECVEVIAVFPFPFFFLG